MAFSFQPQCSLSATSIFSKEEISGLDLVGMFFAVQLWPIQISLLQHHHIAETQNVCLSQVGSYLNVPSNSIFNILFFSDKVFMLVMGFIYPQALNSLWAWLQEPCVCNTLADMASQSFDSQSLVFHLWKLHRLLDPGVFPSFCYCLATAYHSLTCYLKSPASLFHVDTPDCEVWQLREDFIPFCFQEEQSRKLRGQGRVTL